MSKTDFSQFKKKIRYENFSSTDFPDEPFFTALITLLFSWNYTRNCANIKMLGTKSSNSVRSKFKTNACNRLSQKKEINLILASSWKISKLVCNFKPLFQCSPSSFLLKRIHDIFNNAFRSKAHPVPENGWNSIVLIQPGSLSKFCLIAWLSFGKRWKLFLG